jgi:uncharacterized protein YPO0396
MAMYELRRISLMNWNLLDIADIELGGMTAFIGPVGVGKSTILDAIQTVTTGNQASKVSLNSAASHHKSARSVRDYCLGHTEDTLAHGETRTACHTILVKTYRATELNHCVAVGVVLYADADKPKEDTVMRWIAPGVDFSFEEFADRDEGGVLEVEGYETIIERVRRAAGKDFETSNHAAGAFVSRYQRIMRPSPHKSPDTDQFLKRFRNAIAFEEISDPTKFIRSFVLDEDHIKTEGLRSNLAHWDDLENEMVLVRRKLGDGRSLMNRYRIYADIEVGVLRHEHDEAWYNLRAAEMEAAQEEKEIARLLGEIETKDQEALTSDGGARTERQEAVRKTDKLRESGADEASRMLDVQIDALEKGLRQGRESLAGGLRPISNLEKLDAVRSCLPASYGEVREAAKRIEEARQLLLAGRAPAAGDFSSNIARACKLERCVEALSQNEGRLADERRELVNEAAKLEAARRSRSGAGVSLSPVVEAYIDHLRSCGTAARALPELVDVREGEDEWVLACEAVLGPFREAVLVAPQDYHEAAEQLRELKRGAGRGKPWHQVRLVKSARLEGERSRLRERAVISILQKMPDLSDADHSLAELAIKFLQAQFGQVVKAETMAEIDSNDAAIMRDGTQSQKLSIRVSRDGSPILGRLAQARLAEEQDARAKDLAVEVQKSDQQLRTVKAALSLIEMVMATDTAPLIEAHARIATEAERLATLKSERAAEIDPEAAELMAQIEIHRTAADEADRKQRIAQGLAVKLREKKARHEQRCEMLREAEEKLRQELEQVRQRYEAEKFKNYTSAYERIEWPDKFPDLGDGTVPVVALEWTPQDGADADLDAVVGPSGSPAACRARIRQLRQSRDQLIVHLDRQDRYTRGIAKFCQAYDLPPEIAERPKDEIFHWLLDLIDTLQNNTLLDFEERIKRTRRETALEVREVLVMKLWDQLRGATDEMKVLNHRLRQHRFEGMTYLFDWSVDPEMAPLYRLISKVKDEFRDASTILEDGGDPTMQEALQLIREIFSKTGDASKFEDYRNFLRFELRMTRDEVSVDDVDAQGIEGAGTSIKFTGSLSSRVGTGSGGQRQTPFYVAIAASMAAAYYPGARSGDTRGMGLVCFDEAFSKLDVVNTQELLRFFRDLGLQVLVATPEDKRATIMELADTIVNIRKSWDGTQLYLTPAHIRERAREEMAAANPDRLGRDHFRRLADERKAALERARHAAE